MKKIFFILYFLLLHSICFAQQGNFKEVISTFKVEDREYVIEQKGNSFSSSFKDEADFSKKATLANVKAGYDSPDNPASLKKRNLVLWKSAVLAALPKETLTKFTQDDNITVYQIVDNQGEIRYLKFYFDKWVWSMVSPQELVNLDAAIRKQVCYELHWYQESRPDIPYALWGTIKLNIRKLLNGNPKYWAGE